MNEQPEDQCGVPGGEDGEGAQQAANALCVALGLEQTDVRDFAQHADRERASEWVDKYLGSTFRSATRKALFAELVCDSVIELIDPELIDGVAPARQDVGRGLVERLWADAVARTHLQRATRKEMRAFGAYPRLCAIVDQLERNN